MFWDELPLDEPYLFTVTAGDSRIEGQIIRSSTWRPELGEPLLEGEAFRIVLLTRPEPVFRPMLADPRIAVCSPREDLEVVPEPGRPRKALRESRTQYAARRAGPLEAYAQGHIASSLRARLKPERIFAPTASLQQALRRLAGALVAQAAPRRAGGEPETPPSSAHPHLRLIKGKEPEKEEEILEEVTRKALEDLGPRVTRVEETLGFLLEGAAKDAVERLQQLLVAGGARSFLEAARTVYLQPEKLSPDLDLLSKLEQLIPVAGELERFEAYLEDATLSPDQEELNIDKIALLQELSLSALLENPQSWPTVQWAFEWFRARYAESYLRHHEAFHRGQQASAAHVQEALAYGDALVRLNSLQELGPPVVEEVLARLPELRGAISPCTYRLASRTVKAQPRCPACHITLDQEESQTSEAEALPHTLRQALQEQCRRLSSNMATQLLARSMEPQVERLLKIAQASDLSAFALALDDKLMEFLRRFLRESQIRVSPNQVLEHLGTEFPEIAEWQVQEVVESFRRMLEQRLAEAKSRLGT